MRHVDGLLAVVRLERHRNLDPFDVAVLFTIAVLHRVFGVEFELEQCQTERRRYGMRPGDVLVESDHDKASRQQACAHRVELARDRRVDHVKACGPVPGVMWIAEQDAFARLRQVAAQRDRITADPAGHVVVKRQCSNRFPWRRRGGDSGCEVARAVANADSNERPAEFEFADRPHPLLPGTGRGEFVAVVVDESVVAGDKASGI